MMITTGRKTYQLFDEEKQVWFDIYEAPGIEDRAITAEVPRQVSGLKAICGYLLSKGADAASVTETRRGSGRSRYLTPESIAPIGDDPLVSPPTLAVRASRPKPVTVVAPPQLHHARGHDPIINWMRDHEAPEYSSLSERRDQHRRNRWRSHCDIHVIWRLPTVGDRGH